MPRPSLEMADILRQHGETFRRAHAGHLSLGQLKVMSAIEACRTAELGGHVERCDDCAHTTVAYNSCRNRHCPKCQGAAARAWLAERQADLLETPYFHVVFTLPAPIAAIAYQNKAVVYGLLFKAAADTLTSIAADPKRLGARIGLIGVLHTWGSALTHHPHIHCIVPGGGLSPDGQRWIACRPGFFLPVRVLSRRFRHLFLDRLLQLHASGKLKFFGDLAPLADHAAFSSHLAPLRRSEWVVYAKPPFGGPAAVLAYLARYTHRVAISSSRLVTMGPNGVSFRYKDYRTAGPTGAVKIKTMTLAPDAFLQRFLLHVLPNGFHRIRHYGFLARGARRGALDHIRRLISIATRAPEAPPQAPCEPGDPAPDAKGLCPCCGGPMRIIEVFPRGQAHRARFWIDSS
jgi:hypothetical protein